jgi:hypothetical protein
MLPHEKSSSQTGVSDDTPGVPPSATVALLLSDTLEKDVTELEPLGNKIDTDALNQLCERHQDTDFHLEFTHEGCRIAIEENAVNVSKLDQASD